MIIFGGGVFEMLTKSSGVLGVGAALTKMTLGSSAMPPPHEDRLPSMNEAGILRA